MKKSIKRFLSLFLTLCLMAGIAPQLSTAAAAEESATQLMEKLFDGLDGVKLHREDGAFESDVALVNTVSELYINHGRVLGSSSHDSNDHMALYFNGTKNTVNNDDGTIKTLTRLSGPANADGGKISIANPADIMASAQREICLGKDGDGAFTKNQVAMMTVRSSNRNNMFGAVGSPTTLTLNLYIVADPAASSSAVVPVAEFTTSYAPTRAADGQGYGNNNVYDNAIALATGDLDGDSIDEIIISYVKGSADGSKNEVWLRIYTLNGASWAIVGETKVFETTHTAQNPLMSLDVGDFSGDKLADIAIAASAPVQPAVLASETLSTNSKTAVVTTFRGNTRIGSVIGSANDKEVLAGDLLAAGVSIVDTGKDGKLDLLVGGWSLHNVAKWVEDNTKIGASSPVLNERTPGQQVSASIAGAKPAQAAVQTFYSFTSAGGALTNDFSVTGNHMYPKEIASYTYSVADGGYASYSGPMVSAVALTAAHMNGKSEDPLIFFNNCWYSLEGGQYKYSWDLQTVTNVKGKDTSAATTNPFNPQSHSYNMRAVNLGDTLGRESVVTKVRCADGHVQDIAVISFDGAGLVLDVTSRTFGNRPLSFSCPDTDADAVKLKLNKAASGVAYTDPQVIAALVAPPYHSDFLHQNGTSGLAADYMANTTINYSTAKSTGAASGSSYTVNAGMYFGYEQSVSVFGIELFKLEFEMSMTAGISKSVEEFTTVTTSFGVGVLPGYDKVLITTVPYDVYCYDVFEPLAGGGYDEKHPDNTVVVNVPHSAEFALVSPDEYDALYNALQGKVYLPDLKDQVYSKHTLGDPGSYALGNLGPGYTLSDTASNMKEGVVSTNSYAVEKGISYTTETSQSLAFKAGAGAGGVTAGITMDQTWGQSAVKTASNSQEFSLNVGSLSNELANYAFRMNLACYNLEYQSGEPVIDGGIAPTSMIPVVTTVTDSAKRHPPAALPAAEDIRVESISSNAITLAWTQEDIRDIAYYEVYRDDGTGADAPLTAVGRVPAKAGITQYLFDFTGLSQSTPYKMAIRTVSLDNVKSCYSATHARNTVAVEVGAGAGAVGFLTGIDQDAELEAVDQVLELKEDMETVTLKAAVTAQGGDALTFAALWQKETPDGWEEAEDGTPSVDSETGIYSYEIDLKTTGLPNAAGMYRLAYIESEGDQTYRSFSPTFALLDAADAVAGIEISLDTDTILVPAADKTAALTPSLYATYSSGLGETVSLGAAWSISPENADGISVDSDTGEITVTAAAAAAGPVTVTLSAVYGDKTDEAELTIERAESYTLTATAPDGRESFEVPYNDTDNTYTFDCLIVDQYGNTVDGQVVWLLQDYMYGTIPWVTGLSMSGDTLTINRHALAGRYYKLLASYGGSVSNELPIELITILPVADSYQIFKDQTPGVTEGITTDTVIVPVSGTTEIYYLGKAFDKDGVLLDFVEATIWSLEEGAPITFEGNQNGANPIRLIIGQGSGVYRLTLNDSAHLDIMLRQQLAAPQIVESGWASGGVAGWSPISNASGYNVLLFKDGAQIATLAADGEETGLDCNEIITRSGAGGYTFAVQAVGTGGYATGDASPVGTAVYVNNRAAKTVTLGNQSGSVVAGTAGTVTYAVTATGLSDGSYPVTGSGVPDGVSLADVMITGGRGVLTAGIAATVAAGQYPMSVTIDNITATIGLVVKDGESVLHKVTLSGGGTGAAGGGEYEEGDLVSLYAGSRSGYTFSGWTSPDGVAFANSGLAATTFIMPDKAVTVTAGWSNNTVIDDGGSNGSADTSTDSGGETRQSASANNGGVMIDFTQKGGEVTLDLPSSKVAEILAGADEAVSLDLSKLDNCVAAVIGVSAMERISKAALPLEIVLPEGSVTMDAATVAAIAAVGGDLAAVSLKKADKAQLSERQRSAVGDAPVYDISVKVDGVYVTDLGGGLISIALPYELKPGELAGGIVIYYLDEDGNVEKIRGMYDVKSKTVIFTVSHLSLYAIVHDLKAAWENPFADVAEGDWFYEDAAYASLSGLFQGTSATAFSPNTTMTRGMLVTVLWRLEGGPVADGSGAFTDLTADWYRDAVNWAAEAGIVSGYGEGLFGPGDDVTREQFATILYRYIQYKGGGFEGAWAFPLDFADRESVSDWANEALCYCTMNEIITGKPGKLLDPKGSATRAEAAAMLHRLLAS